MTGTALTAGATALTVALIVVPLVRRWALRGGVMDVPNERSSHAVPTPRTGGIGLVVGSLFGIGAGLCCSRVGCSQMGTQAEIASLVAVILSLSVVGFIDDVWQLSAAKRMPLYLFGALLLSLFSYQIPELTLPLFSPIRMGSVGAVVFTTLFVGWYTNLFNFMDGIDGIAAGAAIVTCGALGFVFFEQGNTPLLTVAVSLLAATIGFLFYNYSPASIFMGDVGSVFLGAACGSLTAAAIELGYLSIVSGTLLMFPFVFDATFTLLRRALRREKVWLPHRTHIYQQMCDLGLSHHTISGLYTGFAALFAGFGLIYDAAAPMLQVTLLVIAVTICGGTGLAVLKKNAG